MRVPVTLPDDLARQLDEYCSRNGLSRSAAIRTAVDRLLVTARDRRTADEAAINAAFGMWADRGVSTDEYLETLREEWEERFPTR